MQEVRPPAVAGTFYPADPAALRDQVVQCLAGAVAAPRAGRRVKAVVAPHAGYVYSGPIAGSAFAPWVGLGGVIRRVVVLGPAHRVPLRGLGLPGARRFQTPLGEIPVAAESAEELAGLAQVTTHPAAHAPEHSLEVELPFLQTVLDEVEIVPLVVGDASGEEVAEVLERLWGDGGTRIVVSTDLSHYLPYDEARAIDRQTADRVLALAAPVPSNRACGAVALSGLLLAARRRGLEPELLDLRSSGDTAGDRRSVVGYGAFAFGEPS